MIAKSLLYIFFCLVSLASISQQPKKIKANKKDIVLDIIARIKSVNTGPRTEMETNLTCLIDTREREVQYIESPNYNGILYGDYQTDLRLIDSLQQTSPKKLDLFLEFDSINFFRNHVIHFPDQDSLGLGTAKAILWYLEIGKPIEGWENLTLYDNLRKSFYIDSVNIQNYSRAYLSIPVILFRLENGVLSKDAVMFVYKILYKENKIQFTKKFSF